MGPEVLFGLFGWGNHCIICGGYIYVIDHIIDHFMKCHHSVYKGDKYIWVYKDLLSHHRDNELYELNLANITVKFIHLILLRWEFPLRDLMRTFGQNSPIKREKTSYDIGIREIVDMDWFGGILLNQSYSCMLCGYEFTAIPAPEVLHAHLVKCRAK